MSKFSLSQETPVIQFVDAPYLPLKKEKKSRKNMAILFSLIFSLSFITILMVGKKIKSILV